MEHQYRGALPAVPCPDIPGVFYGHEAEYIWEQKAETAEAGGLCYIYGQPKDKAGISESVKEFFDGDASVLDVKVRMIYDGQDGDIINQYVNFTKIYNDQVRQYGRTREAVMETIRICKDRNVLAEFFSEREKEVVDIMMTLFNEEYILKTYVESEKQEAAEKTKIGTAQRLYEMGISVQDIAKACQATVETVEQWLSLVKA